MLLPGVYGEAVARMVLYLKHADITLKGEPSYETNLDTIDSTSCSSVHSDRLLLE
jgi:hypothetical protein